VNDDEAVASARAAGLRYIRDDAPGITRHRQGDSWQYRGPSGAVIRDKATLARIGALAFPPAYEDVWICPSANGHLQATGRDARGRKQYRYHAKWRDVRDETKYARSLEFAKALPRIRRRVEADLLLAGMPREKVLATVVRLLEITGIRVGNDEYAKQNGSYGLTTLRGKHVDVRGQTVRFSFKGKSGVKHVISLQHRRLAKIVRTCQDLPGQQLFEYLDDDGVAHPVDSGDVNAYIREISGEDFSAKDFRTWEGSVCCAMLLTDRGSPATEAERKAQVVEVVKQVAHRLGNTPSVCRKCYVHPEIIAAYMEDGGLGTFSARKSANGLTPEERFVVTLLERRARALTAAA
jgi:DNA topoisomerase-1